MAVEHDIELAKNLVLAPILHHKEQLDRLAKSMRAAGPRAPLVLAKALTQDFLHAKKALIKNKLPVDPKAWIAEGGVFDQVIKEVCELLSAKLGQSILDGRFMVAVKGALVKALHADEMASKKSPAPAPEAMPPAAPMGPQGAPMPAFEGMQ